MPAIAFARTALICLAMLLGGCAGKKMTDVGAPMRVTPTNAAVESVDVYSLDRASNPSLPAFRGESVVDVRTYVDPPGAGNRKETKGSCDVTGGSLFQAQLQTPRKIIVPNYGPRSLRLTALCQINGRSASGSVEVFNRTKRDIANSGAANGALGMIVAALIAEAVSDGDDDFEYPPLEVSIEPPASAQ